MSTLRLRVNKYIASDGGPAPRIFARIRNLDESLRGSTGYVRDEQIPISNQHDVATGISVNPGHYFVEVRMPSGEILSDSVTVPVDGTGELVLEAEESPHEWLGWQHLMGNIATQVPASAPAVRVRPGLAAPIKVVSRGLTERQSTMSEVLYSGGSSVSRGSILKNETKVAPVRKTRVKVSESPPQKYANSPGVAQTLRKIVRSKPIIHISSEEKLPLVNIGSPIYWINSSDSMLSKESFAADSWSALAALDGTANIITKKLNAGKAGLAIKPCAKDTNFAIYRVLHGPTPIGDAIPLKSPHNRDFIAIERNNGVELLSLPTPWREVWAGRESVIEIVVQQPIRECDFATSIAVRDERLGVLLGFLSSGALPAVKRIAETATELLYMKTANPLAAAAGGYALVGTAVDSTEQEWHQWIRNLMNHYPHIPDGAIQYATLKLRMRRNSDDIADAAKALKLAFNRGIPIYGLGLRWLLEGLERVSINDSEARVMRNEVQALASRVHPQSTFTILRLGER